MCHHSWQFIHTGAIIKSYVNCVLIVSLLISLTVYHFMQMTWVHLALSFLCTHQQQQHSLNPEPLSSYQIFFLHLQTSLRLYLFLQMGKAAKDSQKKKNTRQKRIEVEKQNKFSDMMPEAERLCRQAGSASSSRTTKERIFKRRQKQRASPANREEGQRQRCQRRNSKQLICSVLSFIFIPRYCREKKTHNTTSLWRGERREEQQTTVPAAHLHNFLIESSTNSLHHP